VPHSSMIFTHTSARCAADPALVDTCFAVRDFGYRRVCGLPVPHRSKMPMKHLSSMSFAAFLFLSSPASAGPPFITDDPEPPDYQHWELYVFSQGTHAMGETSGVVPPSFDFNYGIVPNVQLHIQPGMAFAHANGAPLHLGPGAALTGFCPTRRSRPLAKPPSST
jgi:hypothetical protein